MATVTFEHLAALPALRQFYTLTWRLFGVNIFLVSPDCERSVSFGSPSRLSTFCLALQAKPGGRRLCESCDREHFETCRKSGEPHHYRCHAGLTELIAPILVRNELVAFLQCGQILDTPPNAENWAATCGYLAAGGLDPETLAEEFYHIRVIPPQCQLDLITQLELIGNYAAQAEDFHIHMRANRNRTNPARRVVAAATAYVKANSSSDISLEDIAAACCVSRRTLTRSFQREASLSVLDLLTSVRLRRARNLLADPETTCTQAAFGAGFRSIQNFNRVFKRHFNISPSQWRRRQIHRFEHVKVESS